MQTVFPRGRYWIGDIACVMSPEVHDHWEQHEGCGDGVFACNGHSYALCSTTVGDGCFRSNIDVDFFVDTGILGVIPVELTDPSVSEEYTFGYFVDVTHELTFTYEPNSGKFVFVYDDKLIEIYNHGYPDDDSDDDFEHDESDDS